MATTNLNIRTDKAIKDQAEEIFNEQNTETMILQATIRVRVSVTLNQTGCSFMRFRTTF